MSKGMSFNDLNAKISNTNGIISLRDDVVLGGWLEKSNFGSGIKIKSDNLVIDGNGHNIDARGKIRIFNIFASNVTLKNINFKNGSTNEYGGAIRNEGSCKIINCTFENNFAKEGGNDISNGTQMCISSCEFSHANSIHNIGSIYTLENEVENLKPFVSDRNVLIKKFISDISVNIPDDENKPLKGDVLSIEEMTRAIKETEVVSEIIPSESSDTERPFKPYDGEDEPYIFISYKHLDIDLILPIIKGFHQKGYNVWFDHGLQYGEDYDDLIDFKIDGSDLFVIFISENVIEGAYNPNEYMKKELDVALDTGTKIFPIFLHHVGLKGKYRMQLRGKHSIFLHEYDSKDEFIEDCITAFKEDFELEPLI